MTFYVNAVHLDEHGWNESCVGLFDNNEWAGRGSFCGWYAQEFYLNTTLIAYGVQLRHGGMSYNPKAAFDGGFFGNVNRHYGEIRIGSSIREQKIEANSVEEAIEIFRTQSW